MRRGISPIISYVLLIALFTVSGTGLYFWLAGSTNAPAIQDQPIIIQVNVINSTYVSVINVDAREPFALTKLETSEGDCSFASSTTLKQGVPYLCTFAGAQSSRVTFYGNNITRAASVDFS